jgi:hypothetical protein
MGQMKHGALCESRKEAQPENGVFILRAIMLRNGIQKKSKRLAWFLLIPISLRPEKIQIWDGNI